MSDENNLSVDIEQKEKEVEEQLTILKPLIIGEFIEGGDLAWLWYHPQHARMALIGDAISSPKFKVVEGIVEVIAKRDPNAVFWITSDDKVEEYNLTPLVDLIEFESVPAQIEGDQGGDLFTRRRNFFVTSYIWLLSKIKGVERKDLLPPVSFRVHMEGPLMGYLRSGGKLEESEVKQWLGIEFEKLHNIEWRQLGTGGYKYVYSSEGSLEERALSFLKAVWTYWALTAVMPNPQQMLVVVESPSGLLDPQVDPDIRKIVTECLKILNELTLYVTSSILLCSDNLYPIPEHNYRYKIFMKNNCKDFDLTIQENKNLFPERIHEDWKKEYSLAGCMMDDFTRIHYLTTFGDKAISFLDSYKE